jgi:hypothetical protein
MFCYGSSMMNDSMHHSELVSRLYEEETITFNQTRNMRETRFPDSRFPDFPISWFIIMYLILTILHSIFITYSPLTVSPLSYPIPYALPYPIPYTLPYILPYVLHHTLHHTLPYTHHHPPPDPLKLGSRLCKNDAQQVIMQTVEIFNGRTAMLATLGFVVQETVTGLPVVRETPQFFNFF